MLSACEASSCCKRQQTLDEPGAAHAERLGLAGRVLLLQLLALVLGVAQQLEGRRQAHVALLSCRHRTAPCHLELAAASRAVLLPRALGEGAGALLMLCHLVPLAAAELLLLQEAQTAALGRGKTERHLQPLR